MPPLISGVTLKRGASAVAAAYFRGVNVARGYTLPTPSLIESMDSLTGWSVPGAGAVALDSTNKIQGAAALRLQGNGVSATTPITTKNLAASIAPGTLGVVARYVYNYLPRITSGLAIQFGNSGGTFSTMAAGVAQLSLGPDFGPGGYWTAFHESEDSAIATNGTITQTRIRTAVQNAPYFTDASTDVLISNAKGRPTFVIGFDDGEDSAYDIAYPYMSSRGMVGTLYIPTSNVGVSDSLTWGEITTLKNAGWAICLDGSPDDSVMTGKVSVAQAVSDFTSQWAVLTANGVNSPAMYHLCYPNGLAHVSPTPVQVAAMTGNGTTAVTFGAGANVTNGMTAYGVGVPAGTTVVSGGGAGVTSVVLSNTIPAQTKAAMFVDQSGDFYLGKLAAALSVAGVKSGRITQGGDMYTRFGFGTRALETVGTGFSGMTLVQAKAVVDKAILRGTTIEFYIHRIDADPGGWTESTTNVGINIYQPFFNGLIDYIKTFVDAGTADVLTKPQWYDRDATASLPF